MPSLKVRRVSAFTLIELLTVIAIIGILAAIIIPVVGKVRATARASQAVSNIRQLTQAHMTYANDNRGNIPWTNSGSGRSAVWTVNIAPYAGVAQDFTTSWTTPPSLADQRPPSVFANPSSTATLSASGSNWDFSEFARNSFVAQSPSGNTSLRKTNSLTRIPNPSRSAMIVMAGLGLYEAGWWNTPVRPDGDRVPVGYFDGHVNTLPYTDLYSASPSTDTQKLWNPEL